MSTDPSRRTLASWILVVLTALVFLLGGTGKLFNDPHAVANFQRWGYPDDLRQFVGVIEAIGAVGLLIPATATLAATGLAVVMVGALFTHLTHEEWTFALLPLVVLGLCLVVAYQRRGEVGRWLGGSSAH